MNKLLAASGVLIASAFFAATVSGNPSMIPKHPGYPSKDSRSPVTDQPLANDPGQAAASLSFSLAEGAASEDAHVSQDLRFNMDNERVIDKPGAGVLPKVEGPQIKIDPVVKEATRMKE